MFTNQSGIHVCITYLEQWMDYILWSFTFPPCFRWLYSLFITNHLTAVTVLSPTLLPRLSHCLCSKVPSISAKISSPPLQPLPITLLLFHFMLIPSVLHVDLSKVLLPTFAKPVHQSKFIALQSMFPPTLFPKQFSMVLVVFHFTGQVLHPAARSTTKTPILHYIIPSNACRT